MKDYIRNDTLYGRLLDAAGDDKLPVLDNKTFESMNAEYGKEDMRKNIADYIATERPVFPLKDISEDDMRNSFNALRNFNTNTICTPKEQVEIQDDQVVQAFHDACIKISDKVDIKGYALVAWDEKGVPCISWSTGHVKNPISELMLPTFTQSVFQGILNKKLSTPEDLKDE